MERLPRRAICRPRPLVGARRGRGGSAGQDGGGVTLTVSNEERFSHGGAADGTLGEGSAAGDRAGMRKMCWTKPPPRAPDYGRLMALGRSAVCSIAGIRLADW